MKEKVKLIVFCLILFFSDIVLSQSQNILDYYLPKDADKATLVWPGKGNKSEWMKTVITIKKVETDYGNGYERLEESIIGGHLGASKYNLLIATNTQLSLVYSRFVSAFYIGTAEEITYNPPQIILKLPKTGKVEKWSYKEDNDIYDCQAELVKVFIDGVEMNAIKVYKKCFEGGKYYDWASVYEYYVEGIGLWKIQKRDGKTDLKILERFVEIQKNINPEE